MSVEEMIGLLYQEVKMGSGFSYPGDITLTAQQAADIRAALRAGQAIRDSLGIVAKYLTKDGFRTYRQAEVGDNKLAVEAIEAWDQLIERDV